MSPLKFILLFFLFIIHKGFSQRLFDDFILSDERIPGVHVTERDYDTPFSFVGNDSFFRAKGNKGERFSEKDKKFFEEVNKQFQIKRSIRANSTSVEGSITLMEELYKFVERNNFEKLEAPMVPGIDYFIGKKGKGGIVGHMITVTYYDDGRVLIISSEGSISMDIEKLNSAFKK